MTPVAVRFRGQLAYLAAHLPDGHILPLCRLRYGGSASTWRFVRVDFAHVDTLFLQPSCAASTSSS